MEYFDVNTLPKPNTWPASKQLRKAIKDLKDCLSRINALDKDTKTMIQLVGCYSMFLRRAHATDFCYYSNLI